MTKQLIFYIEPTRLLLFGDDMPDVKEVAFPQDIIADLEVINKEKLEALITATIQTYQVSPLPVTIIFSTGLTFDKDITDIPIDKRKEELKQFLDIVPFQDITSKVFSVGKKAYAVAANNALIESFQAILKKQQFPLTAVVPYSIALLIFPELASTVDINVLVQKVDWLRQYSFSAEMPIVPMQQQSAAPNKEKKNNTRVYALLGIFGLLIFILIFLVMKSFAPSAQKSPVPHTSSFNEKISKPEVAGAHTIRQENQDIPLYRINIGQK